MSVICDSYSEVNYSLSYTFLDGINWRGVGQAFSGNGGKLEKSQWYLMKGNSPTGLAYSKIYDIMWNFGSSAVPHYPPIPLAISDAVNVADLTEDVKALYDFNFTGDNQIILGATTKYIVTFEFVPEQAHPNIVYVYGDHIDPTHSGNACRLSEGMPWAYTSGTDMCFYVYTDTPKFIDIIGNNRLISVAR